MNYEEQRAYLRTLIDRKGDPDIELDNQDIETVFEDDDSEDEWLPCDSDSSDTEDVTNAELRIELDDADIESEDENIDDDEDSDKGSGNITEVLYDKGGTVWQSKPPVATQTLSHNIFRQRHGRVKSTKALSVNDTFKCIFTPVMSDIIIRETNRKAKSIYAKWNTANSTKPPKIWRDVDVIEFDGYLGILITFGVRQSNSEDIKELWKSDSYPMYRATMSQKPYWAITRFLLFNNADTRPERLKSDKAAAISDI